MTSSAKSFLFLILLVLSLSALMMYLIVYQEQIAMYIGGGLMLVAIGFIFYVNVPPIAYFLSERASNVLAVYTDASGKGLHIFSSFRTSRIKSGLSPVRTIQYYFLLTETHKLYYKVLFTHEQVAAKGHAGYEGYSSFEEDVLGGDEFKAAIEKYSEKAGWPLQLGAASREGETENYETQLEGRTYRIEKITGMIQDTLQVCCYDEEGKRLWRKKI